MSEKAKDMVLGAFAGDSLALGSHWIFSNDKTWKIIYYIRCSEPDYGKGQNY